MECKYCSIPVYNCFVYVYEIGLTRQNVCPAKKRVELSVVFVTCRVTSFPVKTDQSDSFLFTTKLAYQEVIYFYLIKANVLCKMLGKLMVTFGG